MQSKFQKANHIYRIASDIDLEGGTIQIPSNSILDFSDGGKITNGTVSLNATLVLPNCCDVTRFITATITGTYKEGQVLYDAGNKKMKMWNGSVWVNLDGTALT